SRKIDLECAIPVDKTAKSENGITVIEFPSTNAVVAHYYGAYTGTGAAHEAIDKWLKEKKIEHHGFTMGSICYRSHDGKRYS
ncbi:MAG: hypothetical protein L6Q66_09615, partial [Bacteroidia bacterium]|nr:hypothetical protein [Bacteroidia bacterium]